MISFNGTTWTDHAETLDTYEKLVILYGDNIAEPCCRNKWRDKECGKTTSYIVCEGTQVVVERGRAGAKEKFYKTRFKDLGMRMLAAISPITFLHLDGKLYYPVPECVRCSAAIAGARVARTPSLLDETIARIKDKPLTNIEQDEYRNVFLSAFSNARCKLEQEGKVETIQKARYSMRKG